MYDVGFGDCFLLRLTLDGKTRQVLFDCGSIKNGARPFKNVVRQLLKDLRDTPDGPAHIDVVVATHRHSDHVSGFEDPAWDEVTVGEVWLPWTEKPDDPEGRAIRDGHYRLAELLQNRLRLGKAAAADPAPFESGLAMAANALSNEAAMRTLLQGFAGQPLRRYLPEEAATVTWFNTPHLPGVTIHVLGPSRDPEIIRDLDPPAGQSYLKLMETGEDTLDGSPRPFSEDWAIEPGEYASAYPELDLDLPPSDRQAVRNEGVGLDAQVAAVLDKALNGTSLMLVFQIGAATLLFPGDAQWGTWRIALESPDLRKLLAATTCYKVGHHGSHNATPVEFVEKVLGKDFWGMVSTNTMANWPKIPKKELLIKLEEKPGRVARSDQPQDAGALGFSTKDAGVIEAHIPF